MVYSVNHQKKRWFIIAIPTLYASCPNTSSDIFGLWTFYGCHRWNRFDYQDSRRAMGNNSTHSSLPETPFHLTVPRRNHAGCRRWNHIFGTSWDYGWVECGDGIGACHHWFLDPDFMRPLAARGLWHEAVYRARHQLWWLEDGQIQ